jgi:hypothetical protein
MGRLSSNPEYVSSNPEYVFRTFTAKHPSDWSEGSTLVEAYECLSIVRARGVRVELQRERVVVTDLDKTHAPIRASHLGERDALIRVMRIEAVPVRERLRTPEMREHILSSDCCPLCDAPEGELCGGRGLRGAPFHSARRDEAIALLRGFERDGLLPMARLGARFWYESSGIVRARIPTACTDEYEAEALRSHSMMCAVLVTTSGRWYPPLRENPQHEEE